MEGVQKVDLNEISTDIIENQFKPDPVEFAKLSEKMALIRLRANAGEMLALEDQRIVIRFARMDRCDKFILKTVKVKAVKEYTGKKVSRAKFIVLHNLKETIGLSKEAELDYIKTKAAYKGKKLTKKEQHELLLREHELKEGEVLNYIDQCDKQRTFFGDI